MALPVTPLRHLPACLLRPLARGFCRQHCRRRSSRHREHRLPKNANTIAAAAAAER